MSTVLSIEVLKAKKARKLGRLGQCQNPPPQRDRPDFERLAAGVDEPEPARFAWDYAAQVRMAHGLAQWGPVVLILMLAAWLGWLLIG